MSNSKPDVLDSAAAVIDALGGNISVAEIAEAKPNAVNMWRQNGLPANSFVVLSAELAKRGLRARISLWGMRGTSNENSTTTQGCV